MIYWAFGGAVALARLAYEHFMQPVAKGRAREVRWQSVALFLSVLWTCAMMGYVNVGDWPAALVYAALAVFRQPLPRALFMLFVIAMACHVSMHAVVVTTAAGLPDIAWSLLDLPVFN
jgi:hypothetical protein